MGQPPRIFLSAGEPSGDLHGALLAAALRARLPAAGLEALGGPRMAAAGVTVRFPQQAYTTMGFAEVVGKLPAHWRLLRRLRSELSERRYDLLVLIDYPGFNLRLAQAARRAGVKVLYYIAPKYWASGADRAYLLARAVHRLAAILPFEPKFFARYGVPVEYVGHPLLDQPPAPARETARAALGVAPGERLLALFPGSRDQELRRLWAAFRDAARLLLARGACDRIAVAAVPGMSYPGSEGFVIREEASMVLAGADGALVKSGTATLEAALAGVPMVVAYRVHPFTAFLARRLLTVRWISLVNLIAEEPVVTELLQDAVTPARLAAALEPILQPEGEASRRQRIGFAEVRRRLGGPGASRRVAELAVELLR